MAADPTEDVLDRDDDLDARIIAVRADTVVSRRVVIVGFALVLLALAVGFGGAYLSLHDVSASTNSAVRNEVPALKATIAERDQTIADQEAVIGQAVNAIVQQAAMLRAAGIEPPEVILRPPDHGEDP